MIEKDDDRKASANKRESNNIGTSYGFLILTIIIVFVSYWMSVQGRDMTIVRESGPTLNPVTIVGFRSDFWQLPDDPLLGFVEIPPGQFIMGSNPVFDSQAYENEQWSISQRQGIVDLPLFYMGRFEVTVAQYQAFVDATGRLGVEGTSLMMPTHPVTNITWSDALAYCRWLESELKMSIGTPNRLRELLDQGWHITLPTEAQWEKAARGVNGAIFPWGDSLNDNRANYESNSSQSVGSFLCDECSFGLADMSGNVWELTRSPYQPYPYDEKDDRANLDKDALWVMRGGSFRDGSANIRAAVRGGVDPGVRNETIGFRLVLTLE